MSMVRVAKAREVVGLGKTAFYSAISSGLLPRPVKVGARAAALPAAELDAVNAARLRGASDAEVKALVQRIHAARVLA